MISSHIRLTYFIVSYVSFGDEYTTLKPRVLKQLYDAGAADDEALPTVFGGIVGVTLFGPKAVDALLLPLIVPYYTKWQASLETTQDLEKRFALQQCQQAILVRHKCLLF